MILAAPAGMATAIVPSGPAITTTAGYGLATRAFLRRRENHSSKDKGNHANKRQRENSDVHPSGWGHLSRAHFPCVGSQFGSTKRKRSP